MKVLVTVKRVLDPYVKISIQADHTAVDTQHLQHTINPLDEVALEAAIRLLEAQLVTEIVAVSIGCALTQDTLRHALALGATRAVCIQTNTNTQYPGLHIARILQRVVEQEQPDLVLMGKQAIDDDSSQVPPMLAALMNWPQATAVSALQYTPSGLLVTQAMGSSLATLCVQLPAVVSVDLSLHRPRYVTLPNLLRAQHKCLDCIPVEQLALQLTPCSQVLSVKPVPNRPAGVRVRSVTELVDKLRHEAQVLV